PSAVKASEGPGLRRRADRTQPQDKARGRPRRHGPGGGRRNTQDGDRRSGTVVRPPGLRPVGRAIAAAARASPAAPAAAAPPAAAVAAPAARTRLAGLGLVDREATAVVLLVVQALDGRLRLGVAAHLHEAEALAAARVTVLDHLGALDRPELREQLFEVG